MKYLAHTFGALALLGASLTVNAAAITGEIQIIGFVPDTTTPLSNATGLNLEKTFSTALGTGLLGSWVSGASSGTNTLQLYDFTFDLSGGSKTIWKSTRDSAPEVSFRLEQIVDLDKGSETLSLIGKGTLFATGYDATPGKFAFTYNQLEQSLNGSFSSATSAVPIPAAGWLFGSALMGVVAVARRGRKTRSEAKNAAV